MTAWFRRLPAWSRWTLALLAAFLVALVVTGILASSPLERYRAAVADLRAAGYAVSPAEFAGPSPAPEDNGAPLLDRAVRTMIELAGEPGDWTAPGPWRSDLTEDWPFTADEATLAEAQAFLDRLAPALADVEAAAEKPVLAWPSAASFALPVPHVTTLQHVQKVLTLRTQAARTPEEKVRAARTSLRIGRAIRPNELITGMVATAYRGAAVNLIREQVERGLVPATAAREPLDEELRHGAVPPLGTLARAEIAAIAPVWDDILSDADGSKAAGLGISRQDVLAARGVPLVSWWLGSPEDCLLVMREVAELPPGAHARVRARTEEIYEESRRLPKLFAGVMIQIGSRVTRTEAQMRLARVALAVTERRETTGRWPASLDEVRDLFPDGLPVDPYTDAPFEYAVQGGRARIASPGRFPGVQPDRTEESLVEDGFVWSVIR